MNKYISILRGINVSGHRIIKMEKLRQIYTDLGFENVKSYIQSGNVIFECKESDDKKLAEIIEREISTVFSYEVPVIVIELNKLKQIISENPFLNDDSKNTDFLHITFLSDLPTKDSLDKIIDGQYQNDEFKVVDKSVYLYCPNGYGKTKLTNKFFEDKLKVTATTRNWKTIKELINMAEKI